MSDQVLAGLPVKPGANTTELWTAASTNLLSFAVAIATIVGHPFDSSALQALVPAVAMIAASITSAFYSRSRAVVKAAAHTAAGVIPTPPGSLAPGDQFARRATSLPANLDGAVTLAASGISGSGRA